MTSVGIGTGCAVLGYLLAKFLYGTTTLPTPNKSGETEENLNSEDIPDGDLSAINAGFTEHCKLVSDPYDVVLFLKKSLRFW